ncbi:MAG: DNA polymerase III subunit beta [Clostridia bacterium]|nr:DNA polymerase III subunit beta [Clostridia bacterium]
MKVSFEKEKLLAAIGPAASISQVKNTLTSVEGLLFECPADEKFGKITDDEKGLTRISAYDLEKGLRTTVDCKVYEAGNCVINSSRILQIVRALPDGEIMIETDEKSRAVITGGMSSFEIAVSPSDDFPAMPMFIGDKRFLIPQYAARTLIGRVIFAVAQNDQRAFFNGALMKVRGNLITMVGCDGNRLSLASYKLDEEIGDTDVIIPGKFLGELSRILHDSEEETEIIIGRKHIIFKIGSIYFFTRLIESNYLDYERIFPKSYSTEAYVSPVDLREALERASIISEDKLGGNNRSIVKLDFSDKEISISCVSSMGSIHENVTAAIGGNDLIIGFTGRFLLDALKAVPDDADRIRLRLNSPESGVCIEAGDGSRFVSFEGDEKKADGDEKFDFLHFVMPRRINHKE